MSRDAMRRRFGERTDDLLPCVRSEIDRDDLRRRSGRIRPDPMESDELVDHGIRAAPVRGLDRKRIISTPIGGNSHKDRRNRAAVPEGSNRVSPRPSAGRENVTQWLPARGLGETACADVGHAERAEDLIEDR